MVNRVNSVVQSFDATDTIVNIHLSENNSDLNTFYIASILFRAYCYMSNLANTIY